MLAVAASHAWEARIPIVVAAGLVFVQSTAYSPAAAVCPFCNGFGVEIVPLRFKPTMRPHRNGPAGRKLTRSVVPGVKVIPLVVVAPAVITSASTRFWKTSLHAWVT